MESRIFKNSIINSFGFVVRLIIVFFVTPFLIHTLGNDLYGIWILVTGVTGYMGLLDFGMRTAIVKYVSEYHSILDYEEMNKLGSTALSIFTGIGLFGWLFLILFSFYFKDIFNVTTAESINFVHFLFIVGADVFFTFSFMIYQGSINGFQRYDISVRNGLIAFILRNVLLVLFLLSGYKIIAFSIIVMASNLLGYFLNYISCRAVSSEIHYKIGKFYRSQVKNLFHYSWKSFVTNIADRIIYYSDSIILGIFLTPEDITFYSIATSIIIYIRQLVLTIADVFLPAYSSADAVQDREALNKTVLQGTKLILFPLVPMFCVLFIMGRDFITLWIGEGYDKTYYVLIILLTSQFLVLSQYGLTIVLYGVAKHDILAYINISIAVLNVILSIILLHYWKIIGVAVGTVIPLTILRLAFIPKHVFNVIGMKFKVFFNEIVIPIFSILIIFFTILIILKNFIKISTWLGFFLNLGIALIIYTILFYWIALKKDEKQTIKDIIFAKLRLKLGNLY